MARFVLSVVLFCALAVWQTIHTTHGGRARTVSIPVLPARCDSVELRLSGRGGCLLRTLVREYQIGSDV